MPEKPFSTAHITKETPLIPAINGWAVYLDDQAFSPHTTKAFTADLRLLASYLPADFPIGRMSTTDLDNFLNWMQFQRGVPCSPKTLSRRITSIKAFFNWLTKAGVILINPSEKVVQKSVMSPSPEVLTQSEMSRLLEAAHELRNTAHPDARPYTLLALLLDTGIKKGECLNLHLNHLDMDAPGCPILFIRYTNPQYRYKERKISLSETWIEAYQEYHTQYSITEYLFPWSPRRLEYILEDIGKSTGLEKHLSFAMCRWTCALQDFLNGVEHNKIRQKMGVSSIQWREIRMKLIRLEKSQQPTST